MALIVRRRIATPPKPPTPKTDDAEIKDVFLSYARADLELAEPLKTQLEKHGITVFLDLDDIPIGEQFPEHIQAQLDGCTAMLASWTPRAFERPWCREEWAIARAADKFIPVARKPLVAHDLGVVFASENYAHLQDFEGQEKHHGWSRVLDTLASMFERRLAANPEAADREATIRKVATLRAVAQRARPGPSQTEMESYRRNVVRELESTPWALRAPTPAATQRVGELFVEVKVGDRCPGRSLRCTRAPPQGGSWSSGIPGSGRRCR